MIHIVMHIEIDWRKYLQPRTHTKTIIPILSIIMMWYRCDSILYPVVLPTILQFGKNDLHINTGKPLAHTHMMYSNRTVCVCVFCSEHRKGESRSNLWKLKQTEVTQATTPPCQTPSLN